MKAKVIGGSLNLRDNTSQSAAVLLVLPSGMGVHVKTPGEVWSRVVAQGPDGEETEGYVMTRYLEMLPEAEIQGDKPAKKKAAAKEQPKTPAKKKKAK